MTATTETAAETPGRLPANPAPWFWILTLQWPNGAVSTTDGTTVPGPRQARSDVYRGIFDWVVEHQRRANPELRGMKPFVTFFSLDRDEL